MMADLVYPERLQSYHDASFLMSGCYFSYLASCVQTCPTEGKPLSIYYILHVDRTLIVMKVKTKRLSVSVLSSDGSFSD